jgi:steroid 5-alpha reductase family enzyme
MSTPAAATALLVCLSVCAAAALVTWLLSVLTREYSWVDRAWSLLPPVYLWIFALAGGLADPRLNVMALLGTLWGVRLTLNFARKGGYRPGGEDYRWAVLRERMSQGQFALFNLLFISVYQNLILLLITLPAWVVLGHQSTVLGGGDLLLALLFLAALAGEAIADGQQWTFQQLRMRERERGNVDPGFLRDGLFRFSRHPNYFFEITQWWLLAGFGALAAGTLLQPGTLGAVLLTVLFAGSIALTESISMSRHPGYAAYRASVWPLVPWAAKRHVVRTATTPPERESR